MAFIQPANLEEAVKALAETRGVVLSGGTDFFPARVDRPITETVIDISRVRELKGISIEAERILIGGRTTWSEIASAPLPRGFDGLKSAAREIGGIQIQNFGTVAGNLCNASPAADSVPPLLTLDAEVQLASASGTRTLPLADFILGNRKTARRVDEILTSVVVPRRLGDAASSFLKLGARRYLVISIVMVAVMILVDDGGCVAEARIAVGSCSAQARRLPRLEESLVGAAARPGLGKLAAATHLAGALAPIDDVRATAEYRRDASLTLVQRAIDACVGAA
ncbi:MAG TPA: FAD binding domain-containing protein [Candidatus Acidoferrales bacterium]